MAATTGYIIGKVPYFGPGTSADRGNTINSRYTIRRNRLIIIGILQLFYFSFYFGPWEYLNSIPEALPSG